jgi:oligosaccharide repeat unit polymerase
MIFPLTLITVAGCIAWARAREGGRSPLLLGLYVWGGAIVLTATPLFIFQVTYSISTDAFVAGCLLATSTIYLLVRHSPRRPPAHYSHQRRELFLMRCLGGIGVIGTLLILGDAVQSGTSLSISSLGENLATTRETTFRNSETGTGSFALVLGGLLASCSYLYLAASTRLPLGRVLPIITFVLIAAISLFVFAGRQSIFMALMLVVVGLYLLGWRIPIRFRTVVIGALVLGLVWYSAINFLDQRSEGADPQGALLQGQRATYSPWIAGAAASSKTLGLALFNVSYFSSPLPSLTYYDQQVAPGPYYGAYSFPAPALFLSKITGTDVPDRWAAIRRDIFGVYEGRGYNGNVWATWLRDLRLDFGYLGAICFCGLFGGFMAWARNRFELTGAVHYHCLLTIAGLTFAFGAFSNLLFNNFLAYAFFVGVAFMVAMRIDFRPQRRRKLRTALAAGG